jgi:hypothetical protein
LRFVAPYDQEELIDTDDGKKRVKTHIPGVLMHEIPAEELTLAMECCQFLIIDGRPYENRLGLPMPPEFHGAVREAIEAGGKPIDHNRAPHAPVEGGFNGMSQFGGKS